MSAVRNAEAKRVTSIARAINWGYMWRRLMNYVWLDLLLMVGLEEFFHYRDLFHGRISFIICSAQRMPSAAADRMPPA